MQALAPDDFQFKIVAPPGRTVIGFPHRVVAIELFRTYDSCIDCADMSKSKATLLAGPAMVGARRDCEPAQYFMSTLTFAKVIAALVALDALPTGAFAVVSAKSTNCTFSNVTCE